MLRITRGLDLQGRIAYTGFVVLLTGIILLFAAFSWFSILVFLLGFYMLVRVKTVEFDAAAKRMRFTTTYSFLYRAGEWRSMHDIESVYLESTYDTERSSMMGSEAKRSFRSFEVKVRLKSGQKLLINDMDNYRKALKLGQALADYTGVELKNVYSDLQQSSVRRRRRMGYR